MGIGGMDMAASKIPRSELWKGSTNRVQMEKIYKITEWRHIIRNLKHEIAPLSMNQHIGLTYYDMETSGHPY